MNKKVTVYMCRTHSLYHIPDDIDGVRVFFSEKDIKRAMSCVKDCGIAKYTLELIEDKEDDKETI